MDPRIKTDSSRRPGTFELKPEVTSSDDLTVAKKHPFGRTDRRRSLIVAPVVLLLAACTTQSPELVDAAGVADQQSDATESQASSEAAEFRVDVSSTIGLQLDDAEPSTSTTSPGPNTTAIVNNEMATTTTTTNGGDDAQQSSDAATEEIAFLGPAAGGVGEFVYLQEPVSNPDAECSAGQLGFRLNDQGDIHIYEDLGTLGFARHQSGPRGQDAFIVSCEESIEEILIASSVGADTPPTIRAFQLGDPWTMDFSRSEIGWWGDVLAGWAVDGNAGINNLDLVMFDTETGVIVPLADKVGSWQSMLDTGYDYLLPDEWQAVVDPTIGAVTITSADGGALVEIEPLASAGENDGPSSGEQLDFLADQVARWATPDQGSIADVFVEMQERLSWEWRTQAGTVVIYELQQAAVPVRITLTIDADAPAATTTLAFTMADLFRSHGAAD